MSILSPKRKQILDFITTFIEGKGYAPSVRDIVGGCAISSSSVVQYHLCSSTARIYSPRPRGLKEHWASEESYRFHDGTAQLSGLEVNQANAKVALKVLCIEQLGLPHWIRTYIRLD